MSHTLVRFSITKVRLENGWNSKQMISEGEAAIRLETTLHAFGNQEKSKQRSAIVTYLKLNIGNWPTIPDSRLVIIVYSESKIGSD